MSGGHSNRRALYAASRRLAVRALSVAAAVAVAASLLFPATSGATFEDAGDGVHGPDIDALQRLGVFDGTECGEGLFCPDEPLPRWVVAVWLSRVLAEKPDGEQPGEQSGDSRYDDVAADEWWSTHVERLADLGITLGCDAGPPRLYCPHQPVSRAQMASFLSRAFELEPPDGTETFTDIGPGPHFDDIRALAASGITRGCAVEPDRFCPGEPTTRAQMASFLKRAYTRFIGECPTEPESDATGGGGGGGGPVVTPAPTTTAPRVVTPAPTTTVPPVVPQSVTADPGEASLAVSWTPPDPPDAQAEIFAYRLRWRGPGQRYSDTERWDATAGLSYEISGLANGDRYFVQVAAGFRGESGSGFGEWAETSGVPRTVPGEPRSVRVTSGDESLTVSWNAPADDGGAEITGYLVEAATGGSSPPPEDAAGPGHRIGGLSNGVEHEVRVAAVNDAGAGAWSPLVAATPLGVPDAPVVSSAERGDRSVVVEWHAPAGDGGSAVTGYRVQWRTDRQQFSPSRQHSVGADVSRREITSLVNGVEHFVRVLAVNSVGVGDPSTPVPFTPATTPGRPGTPRLERGDESVEVAWQPPGDGGSAITGYVVAWSDDRFAQSDGQQPLGAGATGHTVTGLTNGTEYSLRVRAVNGVGDGDWSPAAQATPATIPGVPGDVAAERGDRSLTVSWSAPGDGGSPVTRYRVQWRSGDNLFTGSDPSAAVSGNAGSRRVGSLTNGVEYFVRVRAVNGVGDGGWSTAASATPASVAGPPRGVTAVAASRTVTVRWQPPASDGGSAITGYKVQWRAESEGYDAAGRQHAAGAADRSHRIAGLANGAEYFVRVVAGNSLGDGAVSEEASATPATTPGVPGDVAAERGDRSVTASWKPPSSDGGSSVTRYEVQWRSGDDGFQDSDRTAAVTTGTTHRIGSLTNGTEYFVRVRAVNGVGDGGWSAAASAVAAAAPSRPRSVAVQRGDESLSVTWQASADNGGLPITGYRVQWRADGEAFDETDRQATMTDLDDLSHEITGLANGTRYWVRVIATNGAGPGRVSPERSAVPATFPEAPGGPTLKARDRSIDVSWTAPGDGGSPITGYTVQWRADGEQFDDADRQPVGGRTTRHRIGSLTNGTEYFVRVLATNAVGDGPWTAEQSAVPATPPGALRSFTLQPGDGSLTAAWQAPASDGGSPITGYTVQWRADGEQFDDADRQATAVTTSHEVTGLTNGTGYWVRVWAGNAAGAGPATTASGTPRTVPGPPDTLVLHSDDAALLISWDEPADDGGSELTGYTVQWKGPGQEYSTTDRNAAVASPRHQITGLTTGTEYTVRVAAVNAVGTGPAVEESKTVTIPPGAPRSPEVLARNRSLEVRWEAPASSGTLPITGYWVLWKSSGESFDDSTCSFRRATVRAGDDLHTAIGPLRNARTYTVRIVAVSDSGPGDPLDFTGTPAAIPGRPRALGAFSMDGALEVDWDTPHNGGSAITGYTLQWKGPGQEYSTTERQASVTTTSHAITGLTNGTQYTVRVNAINTNGRSRWSETTGSPADAPGRPGTLTATAVKIEGHSECGVSLSWEASSDAGGSPVTAYRVEWKPDYAHAYSKSAQVTDLSDLSHDIVVYWLFGCAWLTYVFRVAAVNGDGAGPPAEASLELE